MKTIVIEVPDSTLAIEATVLADAASGFAFGGYSMPVSNNINKLSLDMDEAGRFTWKEEK